jgi:hypothetical protein
LAWRVDMKQGRTKRMRTQGSKWVAENWKCHCAIVSYNKNNNWRNDSDGDQQREISWA